MQVGSCWGCRVGLVRRGERYRSSVFQVGWPIGRRVGLVVVGARLLFSAGNGLGAGSR